MYNVCMATEPYDPLYLRGIEEFNRRNFFESHEIWEDLWRRERGPDRRFYQGLIQMAVALHHQHEQNAKGAERLLAKARRCLAPYPSYHLGIDLDRFLAEIDRCFRSGDGRVPEIFLQSPPPIAGQTGRLPRFR